MKEEFHSFHSFDVLEIFHELVFPPFFQSSLHVLMTNKSEIDTTYQIAKQILQNDFVSLYLLFRLNTKRNKAFIHVQAKLE